jgi:hypothetical protein
MVGSTQQEEVKIEDIIEQSNFGMKEGEEEVGPSSATKKRKGENPNQRSPCK